MLTHSEYIVERVGRRNLDREQFQEQKWTTNKVHRIPENEIYIGVLVAGKARIVRDGSKKKVNVPKEEEIC